MSVNDSHEVEPATLKEWLDGDRALVVDVREPDEFLSGHIHGASLIPLSRLKPQDVPRGNGRNVVLHCRSGKRAAQAAGLLRNAGHGEVWQLRGGLEAWKEAGLPIEGSQRVPISIMRQVQITAGLLILAGTVLGAFLNPWFLALSGFVGAGLMFAGASGTCGMASMLSFMPWNKVFRGCGTACAKQRRQTARDLIPGLEPF